MSVDECSVRMFNCFYRALTLTLIISIDAKATKLRCDAIASIETNHKVAM